MPDLMPNVSVGTKVIPFDGKESKSAPEAIEKSLTIAVYRAAAVVFDSLDWPNRLPGA